jgi:hypothetical protein
VLEEVEAAEEESFYCPAGAVGGLIRRKRRRGEKERIQEREKERKREGDKERRRGGEKERRREREKVRRRERVKE